MGEAKRKRDAGFIPEPEPQLFIGLPSYGGSRINTMAIIKAMTGPKSFRAIACSEMNASLLAMSFNVLWTKALMARAKGITHFLLFHADILPLDDDWLIRLHREMVMNDAKVMSAIVPIKDSRGLTSTAIEGPTKIAPRRLTMKEIMDNPVTFTHPELLVNTGMLLVDIRDPWVEDIVFTIKDTIVKNADGTYTVGVEPEDWDFSRQARAKGIQLWATRAVKVVHQGGFNYPNFAPWGSDDQDKGDQFLHAAKETANQQEGPQS